MQNNDKSREALHQIVAILDNLTNVDDIAAAQLVASNAIAELDDCEAAMRDTKPPTVDHRKIGCLIHDAIKTTLPKHLNVIRIYDAIKPYLPLDDEQSAESGGKAVVVVDATIAWRKARIN